MSSTFRHSNDHVIQCLCAQLVQAGFLSLTTKRVSYTPPVSSHSGFRPPGQSSRRLCRSHSGLYFVTRLASHVSRHVSVRLTRVLVPEAPPASQPRALLPSALFTSEGHLHPREQLMQTVGTCSLHAVHGDEDLTSGG